MCTLLNKKHCSNDDNNTQLAIPRSDYNGLDSVCIQCKEPAQLKLTVNTTQLKYTIDNSSKPSEI